MLEKEEGIEKIIGLKKRGELLEEEIKVLLEEISQACRQYNEDRARLEFEKLIRLNDLKREVDELVGFLGQQVSVSVYVISSWFLYDSFIYLTRKPTEDLCFVTGLEFDGIYIPDNLVIFELEERNMVCAIGDFSSTHEKLLKMDEYGHRLLVHFHSHPGNGEYATSPSHVDKNFQERLERGGYPVIGGIFSRDGHVRFFSLKREFKIQIFGKGVKNVSKDVYQIENTC